MKHHRDPTTHVHRSRLGGALHIAMAIAAVGGAVWMGVASTSSTTSAAKRSAKAVRLDPPNRFEIEVALGRVGLDPRALAAAGLSAEQAGVLAGSAADFFRSNILSYREADAAANAAAQERDRLVRRIQAGISTEQERAACVAAVAAFASAAASRQAVLSAACQAGAGALQDPPRAAVLEAFRTNHVVWDLPIEFLGDNRSEADWVALRDAAANDRISARLGQEPDPTAHQLILTASATTNAAAAITNLPNLQAIQTAWDEAIGP